MVIKCPRCGNVTTFEGNPYRPFCSERCRMVDLGNWVTEAYRIPARIQEEEEDGAPTSPTEPTAE